MSAMNSHQIVVSTSSTQINPYSNRKYTNPSLSTDANKTKLTKITQSKTSCQIKSDAGGCRQRLPPATLNPPTSKIGDTNLTNLRDILNATHHTVKSNARSSSLFNGTQCKKLNMLKSGVAASNTKHASQASLVDILKLTDTNANAKQDNRLLTKQQCENSKLIIDKIEQDLQESLRMLKHYNQVNEVNFLVDKDEDQNGFIRKSIPTKLGNQIAPMRAKKLQKKCPKSNENEENNDLKQVRLELKTMPKENNFLSMYNENCLAGVLNEPVKALNQQFVSNFSINSSSESIANKLNAPVINMDSVIFKINHLEEFGSKGGDEVPKQKSMNNQLLFNELMCQPGINEPSQDLASNYWSYDELNELRIKFTSLLSADKAAKPEESHAESNKRKSVLNAPNKLVIILS